MDCATLEPEGRLGRSSEQRRRNVGHTLRVHRRTMVAVGRQVRRNLSLRARSPTPHDPSLPNGLLGATVRVIGTLCIHR